ncbi:MAG: flagellar protein FlaG [Lachnospiraceae bacterium]|nr:flagellar protein FlaG [Lachnospiraceae bacterium]
MKIESVSNQAAAFQVNRVQQAGKTEIISKEAMDGNQTGTLTSAGNMEEKHVVTPAGTEEKNNADNNSKSTQQSTNDEIKKAVDQLNKKMSNSEAIFGIHEETNRVTIKIVDKNTKEVIKELPPEKTLDMIAKAWELAGLLVDEKR